MGLERPDLALGGFTRLPPRRGPLRRIAVVAAGYAGAFLIACAALAFRIATTSGPEAQASSGMYAFGDALLFVFVFALSSLAPTAMALYLLRPYRRVWAALSAAGLALAGTGLAAVVLFAVGRHATQSPLSLWADVSVLRILIAPLLAAAFVVCALFAPRRGSRLGFLAAAGIEVIVSAYGGFVWFLPLLLP